LGLRAASSRRATLDLKKKNKERSRANKEKEKQEAVEQLHHLH
jgi:hypothetical protein